MPFEPVEVSRTQTPTATRTVVTDYFRNPAVCRDRVWVGQAHEYVERVVLEVEDIPPFVSLGDLLLGWLLAGSTFVGLYRATGTQRIGGVVPGHPSVTYEAVGRRIEFTSTPGQGEECFSVRVHYRILPDTPQRGVTKQVCISGTDVGWPKLSLGDEQECLKGVRDFFDRHKFIPPDRPWPPIERALRRLRGDDAVRIRAHIDTLDRLDPNAEKELFQAVSAELHGFVEGASLADEFPAGRGAV
jgi:hypothetical protein